jgi:hypothetical protein
VGLKKIEQKLVTKIKEETKMPHYTPHPKKADTPSRKSRKSGRTVSFIKNKVAGRLQRKARKDALEARLAAQQEELEVTE